MSQKRSIWGPLAVGGLIILLLGAWFWKESRERQDPLRGPGTEDLRDGPRAAEAPQGGLEVWERAIEAAGGREALTGIRSLETVGETVEPGRPPQATRALYAFPDRYRLVAETLDASLVHAIDGERGWETLDGVEVPLQDEDLRQLREQVVLARLSLLVSFRDKDVELRALGTREGLEWVQARLPGERSGPFRLGFDPQSMLLTRATWISRVFEDGGWKDADVELALSDYRQVAGIKVPFAARFSIDGEERLASSLSACRINPEVDPTAFGRPVGGAEAPIVRRRLSGVRVLTQKLAPGAKPQPADLLARLKELGLQRCGPRIQFFGGDPLQLTHHGFMVRPVEAEGPAPSPAPSLPEGEDLELRDLPERDALTLVLSDPAEEARASARARLAARAAELGLTAAGEQRLVMWSEDGIVQVQYLLGGE